MCTDRIHTLTGGSEVNGTKLYHTFKLNWENILPVMGCREELAMRYALPYQPTSDRELNWVVISGIACTPINADALINCFDEEVVPSR
jgi:hypothetical protein